MSLAPFEPEAIIDAMAPLLGLDVRPDYRAAVATNLRIAAGMAAQVLEAPIDDHAEPAALFVPGRSPSLGSPRSGPVSGRSSSADAAP